MLVFVGEHLHTHASTKRVHDPLKPHPVEHFLLQVLSVIFMENFFSLFSVLEFKLLKLKQEMFKSFQVSNLVSLEINSYLFEWYSCQNYRCCIVPLQARFFSIYLSFTHLSIA